METSIIILACIFAVSAPAGLEQQATKAEQIIQRYLEMPNSESQADRFGQVRDDRMAILSDLKSMPNEAVDAIGRVLPQTSNHQQKMELIERLGFDLQTKKSAEILCGFLKDPDDRIRRQAIQSLRQLARNTDRTGAKRTQIIPDSRSAAEKEKAAQQAIQQGVPYTGRQMIQPQDERLEDFVEFAPKVEGLVPYLIAAANDPVESNRITALYALADTRDTLAVLELRNRLKDSSEKVRLYAACFLTEYQDASGLFEMKNALARLCRTDIQWPDDFDFYSQAERLLASFERITGKSFGQIPMNPSLLSVIEQIIQSQQTYKVLLQNWSQWWTWEPKSDE